jgi:hypothetical protein
VSWMRKLREKAGKAGLRSATSDREKRNKSGKPVREVDFQPGEAECWGAKDEQQARENKLSGLLKAGAWVLGGAAIISAE